jgi:hypothetical protein
MSDNNVAPFEQPVDFDLDAAQRPPERVKPLFKARIGGRVVEFADPETLDWKDLLDIEEPVGFLRYSVSEADRMHIIGLKMEAWRLGDLMEAYQNHYGFEDKLAEARRRARLQGVR